MYHDVMVYRATTRWSSIYTVIYWYYYRLKDIFEFAASNQIISDICNIKNANTRTCIRFDCYFLHRYLRPMLYLLQFFQQRHKRIHLVHKNIMKCLHYYETELTLEDIQSLDNKLDVEIKTYSPHYYNILVEKCNNIRRVLHDGLQHYFNLKSTTMRFFKSVSYFNSSCRIFPTNAVQALNGIPWFANLNNADKDTCQKKWTQFTHEIAQIQLPGIYISLCILFTYV